MKKVFSLVLAVVLATTMLLTVTAAPRNSSIPTIHYITKAVYGDYMGDVAIHPEDVGEESELIIPLLMDGFMDENNATITDWAEVHPTYGILGPTVRQLKQNRVVPVIHDAKMYRYIKDISLVDFKPTRRNPAQAAIRVRFTDDFISTAEVRWQFEIYLQLDGAMTDASVEVYGGKLSNPEYDVYGLDYLYIGDGQIAYCSKDSAPLELDLGNGVSMFRNMYEGERYYGKAFLKANEGQDAVAAEYKDIVTIIDIKSVEVKFNGNIMKINKELRQEVYYVYNLAGEFIGMSDEMLPYSTRYYLSLNEIEIDPELAKEQLPILSPDEEKLSAALSRFIEGGKAADNVIDED